MQLSQVDANLIVALGALLREQSVARAARALGLSPSATSHALGRLRRLFDDELLTRSGRGLVLTARGEALRPLVEEAVERMERVLWAPERFDPAHLRRTFRVAATDHVELVLLPHLDAVLRAEAPGVDLVFVKEPPNLSRALATEIDLGLGLRRAFAEHIYCRELIKDRFVTLLREGHPAAEAPLTPEIFAALDHVLVAPRGTPRGIIDDSLAALGLRRRVARAVSSFLAAPFLVAQSDYVVTLPWRVAASLIEPLRLVTRLPPVAAPDFSFVAGWHPRLHEDPAHRWLREQIHAVASGLPRVEEMGAQALGV